MPSIPKRLLLTCALLAPGSTYAGGESAGPLNFVPIEEIKVPIVDTDKVTGAIRVKLVLQAANAEAAAEAGKSIPALRAAGLSGLMEFARLYASPYTPVDVSQLDANLSEAIKAGNPGIARVLIVEVEATTA